MQTKPRVLFVGEASYLNTGYSTYTREVIKRLHATGKYEVAEFSVYGNHKDPRRNTIPWKNYPNHPAPDNPEELEEYNKNPIFQFGAKRFERVCLDFRPTHVLTIRDYWMDSFIAGSIYRPRFRWIWMPTVDAEPQSVEWIGTFSTCDALLTYTDWAIDVLKRQAGDNVNIIGAAPASAQSEFQPLDKVECRQKLGLPADARIVGTVMRNQRRKLFDDVFSCFRKYLDKTQDDKAYLHLHTGFPDNGWPLNNMLVEYGLSSRVFLTYVCENPACNNIFASKFHGSLRQCPSCGEFKAKTSGVAKGASCQQLAEIYNSFDAYLQLANSEGFGIPMVEAAACNVPVLATDYSAMQDVVRKVGGLPIKVSSLYREMETGCYRAVPDHDHVVELLTDVLKGHALEPRKNYQESYGWGETAKMWEKAVDSLDALPPEEAWKAPPTVVRPVPPEQLPQFPSNKEFIDWMTINFLQQPQNVASYSNLSLLRDYNNGMYKPSPGGFFYSETSIMGMPKYQQMTAKDVYDMFAQKLKQNNFWEQVRAGSIQLEREDWMND